MKVSTSAVAALSLGQKLRGSFLPGVVFAKRCEFVLVFLEEGGLGSGSGGWRGVVFLWKVREKEKGAGEDGGSGGDRQRNRQVNAHAFVKTAL